MLNGTNLTLNWSPDVIVWCLDIMGWSPLIIGCSYFVMSWSCVVKDLSFDILVYFLVSWAGLVLS